MSHDLKEHERVLISLEVIWEGASGKHNARISDISSSGCYIDSIGKVACGETVTFKVRLPTGHWIQLQGEVVEQEWHAGFDLRFTGLTEEEKVLLTEVIKAQRGVLASQLNIKRDQDDSLPKRHQDLGRVLVAEDDAVSMRVVTAILEKEGYVVVPAKDGREAYQLLRQDADFAAAIFDMNMPYLQGIDLIQHMGTEKRLMRIPVGIITAGQDPKLWNDSFAAGAGIFLPKPFSPNQLQFMLRVLISKGGSVISPSPSEAQGLMIKRQQTVVEGG